MEGRSIVSQLVPAREIGSKEESKFSSSKKTNLWVGADSPKRLAIINAKKKKFNIDKMFGDDVPSQQLVQTNNTASNLDSAS